ncbi:hypothetical protein C8F01DRAFT_1105298 [Mycena amicta]|nr:hypothetical protein C8F01DRAFT_1105298 [Mycena amicta]
MKRGFLNSAKSKARPLGSSAGYESNADPLNKTNVLFTETSTEILVLPPNASPDEPVTVCFFWAGSKEILKSLGFPRPLRKVPGPPSFRVGPSPGKGSGLFATRPLRQGELIMDERPLLVSLRGIPTSQTTRALQLAEFEKQLEIVLDHMRPADRDAFMALANCHTTDGSGPIAGRARTNAIALTGLTPPGITGPLAHYSSIPHYISRMNNDCSPNTASNFIDASLSYTVYAARDIAEGEEITLAYTDVFDTAAQRQAVLNGYKFVCTCAACLDPTTSDRNRAAIASFIPTVHMWAVNSSLSDDWLIEKCLEQIVLIEQEKLEHDPRYHAALQAIMEAYICLGDTSKASEWAARAQKCSWAANVERMGTLLDPASPEYQNHPMWRLRVDDAPTGPMGAFKRLAALPGGRMGMTDGGGGFMVLPMPGMKI